MHHGPPRGVPRLGHPHPAGGRRTGVPNAIGQIRFLGVRPDLILRIANPLRVQGRHIQHPFTHCDHATGKNDTRFWHKSVSGTAALKAILNGDSCHLKQDGLLKYLVMGIFAASNFQTPSSADSKTTISSRPFRRNRSSNRYDLLGPLNQRCHSPENPETMASPALGSFGRHRVPRASMAGTSRSTRAGSNVPTGSGWYRIQSTLHRK